MPAIIDSSPDCVQNVEVDGTDEASVTAAGEDSLDFVVGDNYADCAGFGTFMPGSTYGPEGAGAESLYMILTWAGIVFMVLVLIAWTLYENRRMITYAAARVRGSQDEAAAAAQESELA